MYYENFGYENFLDKSCFASGKNVIFPDYQTVFHATFNEASKDCSHDYNCIFGDYNCATGEFNKYRYDLDVPSAQKVDQLITSNGHVSMMNSFV